ncbi:hypothetical protein [Bacillus gaemokensis]|uniref:hypothetical protein n=1 Tax=Bacillus gaemokensis TaxID=574375 RepID=UPI000A56CAAF|nr:hypothetical protein [Bacillus gaemokensis]
MTVYLQYGRDSENYAGGEAYRMSQLSFFEDINEKGMRRLVVKVLKNYKAFRVQMKH